MPSVALGCAARPLDLQGFMQWFRFHNINVGNPVINLPFGDGVYHPFVVILLDSLLKLLKVHLTWYQKHICSSSTFDINIKKNQPCIDSFLRDRGFYLSSELEVHGICGLPEPGKPEVPKDATIISISGDS